MRASPARRFARPLLAHVPLVRSLRCSPAPSHEPPSHPIRALRLPSPSSASGDRPSIAWKVALVLAALSFLAACNSASGVLPSPGTALTPSGVPVSDKNGPVEVAGLLFPDSGAACGHSGNYGSCPMTPEL